MSGDRVELVGSQLDPAAGDLTELHDGLAACDRGEHYFRRLDGAGSWACVRCGGRR